MRRRRSDAPFPSRFHNGASDRRRPAARNRSTQEPCGIPPRPLTDSNRRLLNAEIAAREIGELSLGDALAFCVLLAEADPPRFDRAIARWHALFVLEAGGITADEAAFALPAAKGWLAPRLATCRPDAAPNSRRRMGLERTYSPCVGRTVTDESVILRALSLQDARSRAALPRHDSPPVAVLLRSLDLPFGELLLIG